jgi:hypothetical protein
MKTVGSMKNLSATLLALTSLTLSGLSLNTQAENDVYTGDNWLLAKYDSNGDSQITLDEITSKKLNIFKHMDLDNDGGVSFKEYESLDLAKRKALLTARFIKLDTDHNGKVTQKEYSSYMGMFASIDSNGDGALTEAEINSGNQADAYISHCLWMFCFRTKLDDEG